MTTVQISPEVQLQEAKSMIDHLCQRNLFLAQSLRQSFEIGFGMEKQIAELQARIAELEGLEEPPAEPNREAE